MQDKKMPFRQKLGAVLLLAAFGFCANVMAQGMAVAPSTPATADQNATGQQTAAAPEQPAKPQPPGNGQNAGSRILPDDGWPVRSDGSF